jgi:hypothetical protein
MMAKREKPSGRAGAASAPRDERPEPAVDQKELANNQDDASLVPTTQPVEARHDVGSGEEETDDGLDPTSETVRKAAEGEVPEERIDDVPVFDRANRSEKI